ncbi:MAG: NADH-quinone oxidoreductase subunit C, partial [Promethearchaeota archaeon]
HFVLNYPSRYKSNLPLFRWMTKNFWEFTAFLQKEVNARINKKHFLRLIYVITMPSSEPNKKIGSGEKAPTQPLLLRNLKKFFRDNIRGPIKKREREYQASIKAPFLLDVAKFLSFRGVKRLSAITAWKTEREIAIAYHFVAQLGKEFLDSKITIIALVPKNERKIKSLQGIYSIARIFEKDLEPSFKITFEN